MEKIKVGYLPFYIKLYDDSNIKWRDPVVAYMNKLIKMIEDRGFEVVPADEICRIKPEFDRAAAKFNSDPEICAVITQHLAYSPSLESIDALKSLKAPLIVFDTTPDRELIKFAETEDRIMDNHGIHGVQDMCNLLKRNRISYELCVGHVSNSPVLDELCGRIRAAYAAKTFRECRIGMSFGKDIAEMFFAAGTTTGDDRYLQVVGQLRQSLIGISGFHTVVVHAGEENLASTTFLYLMGPLKESSFCAFATSFQVAMPAIGIQAGIDGYHTDLTTETRCHLLDKLRTHRHRAYVPRRPAH